MADGEYLLEIVARLRNEASAGIQNLKREIADLKAQAAAGNATGDLERGLGNTADEAERAARAHDELNRQHQQTRRESQQSLSSLKQQARAQAEGAEAATGHAASVEELRQQAQLLGQEAGRSQSSLKQTSAAHATSAESVAAHAARVGDLGASLRDATTSTEDLAGAQSKASARGDELIGRMQRLDQAARSHTASNKELEIGYKQVASGLRSVWKEMEVGSGEADKFGRAMDDAAKKAGNIDLARANGGFSQFAQQFAHATDQVGIKIISLSAALRGLRLVSLVGLLQPLDTGLVSLAGSLFSVASGAAQAAATLGGVFISGLGQMIPMLSIAVAGLMRLQSVFQAVQAAQQARQQTFFEPNQGLINQLQNTNALIESEQNLKNAYIGLQDAQVQVRESQIELTQARIDAVRNLQDLILAEQQAKLELKGSNLSLTQSQEELRAAEASGQQQRIQQAQLSVQEAELGVRRARLGVPRSQQDLQLAVRYGVTGSPQVLGAEQAVRQAGLAVQRQQQQIASAQRQMQITQLQAQQPASHESSQQATLQYLLSQMSGPEKALFTMLNRIEMQLRSPNGPLKRITDALVEPFLYAFGRLETLLGDPKFLAPVQKLANAMGTSLDTIFKAMFGSRGTSFFETMASDASRSLPIVTRAITGLIHVFQDIATAAAPAFNRLSRDWAKFWNALDRRDSSPQGQARLEHFFNQGAKWAEDFGRFAKAVFDLFAALGRDAAPQGMKTVTSFTEAIKDATSWVQTHGPEVTNFFSQTRQGLGLIAGVLFNLGKAMLQIFDLTSLRAFAGLINTIILPAAKDFADAVGFVVTQVMKLVNAFGPARVLLEGLVAGFFGLMALNRVIGIVTRATDVIHGIKDAMKAFRAVSDLSWFSRIGAAWDALTGRITKGKTAIEGATGAQEALVTTTEVSAAKEVTAQETVNAAIVEQTGLITAEEADLATLTAGGTVVGAGAVGGAAGAGTLGAEGAVGGTGLLATLGVGGVASAALGPLALGGLALYLASQTGGPKKGTTDTGLASLLGPVGGTHRDKNLLDRLNPFDGSGFLGLGAATSKDQTGPTGTGLKTLQDSLKGISDPAQLSTTKLQSLFNKAQQLLQMPDITATQRHGLEQLVGKLNPAIVAMQKAQSQVQIMGTVWGQTFSGISATTGNVMKQVQQNLQQDLQNISANLGTGTKQGAEALVQTTAAAWQTVLNNTSAAVRGTAKAIAALNTMLNRALKAMGQGNVSLGTGAGQVNPATDTGIITSLLSGTTTAGGVMNPHATGGWHEAARGGHIATVGEGGFDEVTLTTDPRHAPRQRSLLGQYLRRAPHLAKGGLVGSSSVYTSPFGSSVVNWGRTDMGVDLNLPIGSSIGTIGNAQVSGVLPNWYAGQPLIYYKLTDGPDAGRYVYVAEQISGVRGIPSNDPRATSSLQSEVGARLSRGQRLGYFATSGTGIETGWATSGGQTLAQATTGYSEGQQTTAGSSFRSFLQGLSHGVIRGGAGIAQMLKAPSVGAKGAIGQIAQGVVNNITAAANSMLGASGTAGTSGSLPQLAGGTVERQIASFFRGHGLSDIAIAGIIGNWMQESSLNPATPGGGLGQWIGSRGAGLAALASREGVASTSAAAQLQFAWQELTGPERAALTAIQGATSPQAAAAAFSNIFERPGTPMMANRESYAAQAYAWLKSHGFASGGLLGRAPWGGTAVPIIAHEGERISNPGQWGEIARMAGTTPSGLDNHLGYDGVPRQSFQDGGKPWSHRHTDSHAPATSALTSVMTLLQNVAGNLYTQDPGALNSALGVIAKIFQAVSKGFDKIGKLGGGDTNKQLSQLNSLVGAFADPSNTASTLNLLAQAFQRFQNNLANWITGLSYLTKQIDPRRIARPGHRGLVSGSGDAVALAGTLGAGNIGHVGQAGIDLLTERSLAEQSQYLSGQSTAVQEAINRVTQSIGRVKHSKLSKATKDKTVKQLESQYTNLIQQQETLTTQMNQIVTQRFQQEQTYIQDTLNQISDIYQTQQTNLQAKQAGAQALGSFNQLPGIDQALAASAKSQIQALIPALHEAQKIHDPDLVAQIQQQISQLQETITESAAQMIQDSISAVQQGAQTQQAKVSMLQTISQTMTQNASTPGQFALAGGVNLQALQLNESSLKGQVGQYNTLLAQAINQGNQGAVATLTQTIDGLTAQLVQNENAIQDNTAQVVSQTAQFIQSRGQFQSGIYGGLGQIIQTIGQTTGFTDVASLKKLTSASNIALQGTNQGLVGQLSQLGGGATGLAGLLSSASTPQQFVSALSGANLSGIEAGHDQTWINTFEGLISNLEQNTGAIAQNNQQLATLNGQLLQPQQWSTTAWSSFRTAIFSGMGNLLPQFQAALPAGSAPSIAPTFSSVPSNNSSTSPTIGTLNINHAPTSTLNPQIIGEQLAHETSNAL